jgi:hypothetical protein
MADAVTAPKIAKNASFQCHNDKKTRASPAISPPGRNRRPCDNFSCRHPNRPPWRALPVLGGSSSRLQLVDKSVELRARLPPSADRLARESREDGEKP